MQIHKIEDIEDEEARAYLEDCKPLIYDYSATVDD